MCIYFSQLCIFCSFLGPDKDKPLGPHKIPELWSLSSHWLLCSEPSTASVRLCLEHFLPMTYVHGQVQKDEDKCMQ